MNWTSQLKATIDKMFLPNHLTELFLQNNVNHQSLELQWVIDLLLPQLDRWIRIQKQRFLLQYTLLYYWVMQRDC